MKISMSEKVLDSIGNMKRPIINTFEQRISTPDSHLKRPQSALANRNSNVGYSSREFDFYCKKVNVKEAMQSKPALQPKYKYTKGRITECIIQS